MSTFLLLKDVGIQLVDELIVECPNRSIGCTHSCQRQFVDAHIRESCQFVSIPCPTHQCRARILKRDIAQHTHHPSTLCDACGTTVESTNTEVRIHKPHLLPPTILSPHSPLHLSIIMFVPILKLHVPHNPRIFLGISIPRLKHLLIPHYPIRHI